MSKRKKLRPGDEFQVESRVRYPMPGGLFDAIVVEDRGDIGVNGRRLLGIRPLSEYSGGDVVWPAEELVLAEPSTVAIGVGSRVLYHLPWGTMKAEVIEDRGKFRGRTIMRIRPFLMAVDDPEPFEVPLKDLTLAE
jgi:hypothetical protein